MHTLTAARKPTLTHVCGHAHIAHTHSKTPRHVCLTAHTGVTQTLASHPASRPHARPRTHARTRSHGRAQTEYYRYEKVLKETLNSFAKSVVTRLIEDKDDTVNPEKIPEFNVAFFNLAEQASLTPPSSATTFTPAPHTCPCLPRYLPIPVNGSQRKLVSCLYYTVETHRGFVLWGLEFRR